MKQKIKHIAILLFLVAIIACNNNSNENNKTQEKLISLTNENDSTIVIAQIVNGVATFVADSNTLRNDWQKFIGSQPDLSTCQLNRIEIITNPKTMKYYLVASGKIKNEVIKSTMELKQGTPTCYIISGLTTICTTKACANQLEGCLPDSLRCTPCGNKGDCTKSITTSVFAIFPSIAPSFCQN